MDEEIIKQNLEKMISRERGGMRDLLMSESIGGNAGSFEFEGRKLPCGAVNFYYDSKGKVIAFDNFDSEIHDKYPTDRFKIAIKDLKTMDSRIVGGPYNASGEAKENLEASRDAWNNKYGFKVN